MNCIENMLASDADVDLMGIKSIFIYRYFKKKILINIM